MELVKSKLAKVQNNVNTYSKSIEQIQAVFHSLDSEFQNYLQDQNVNDIQVLKSTVCDNKPLMDTVQITQLSDLLIKCQENIDSLFTQSYELSFMSNVIGEVTKEMQKIRTSMEKFKQVEILESCMKVLKKAYLMQICFLMRNKLKSQDNRMLRTLKLRTQG